MPHVGTQTPNPADGPQNILWCQYADLTGDGTGTDDFITDYSGFGNDEALVAPPAGTIYRIARMIVEIEDGNGMRAERYASLSAALTTGIDILFKNASGTIVNFTGGDPIKSNAGWGRICYDVDVKAWGGGKRHPLSSIHVPEVRAIPES